MVNVLMCGWSSDAISLETIADDLLELDSVGRELADSLRQLVVRHLVLVHLPAEDLLVDLHLREVRVLC